MAKDDYLVIVYQILAYLYRCLKDGIDIDPAMLEPNSGLPKINRKYWLYIMENMQKQGYIKGIVFQRAWGQAANGWNLENCQITPAGIEYMCENSTVKKVYRILEETAGFLPFDPL